MKNVLSVDVAKLDKRYSFTLHHHKKATTFDVNSLVEGFRKVMQITNDSINEIEEV